MQVTTIICQTVKLNFFAVKGIYFTENILNTKLTTSALLVITYITLLLIFIAVLSLFSYIAAEANNIHSDLTPESGLSSGTLVDGCQNNDILEAYSASTLPLDSTSYQQITPYATFRMKYKKDITRTPPPSVVSK